MVGAWMRRKGGGMQLVMATSLRAFEDLTLSSYQIPHIPKDGKVSGSSLREPEFSITAHLLQRVALSQQAVDSCGGCNSCQVAGGRKFSRGKLYLITEAWVPLRQHSSCDRN
ncbi:hypothetical protein Hanom_Chr04g00343051 [Helianthus anomalus]